MKITSPVKFSGRTYIGPLILDFEDGVASHDGELAEGIRSYLESNGYGIGSKMKPAAPEKTPAPPDPRDHTVEQVGSKLRDAAVDPQPEDFLPPINAGEPGELGNPHGPTVVAPGIHAITPGIIVPGPVGRLEKDVVVADTDEQQRRETTAAEKIFVAEQSVPEVTAEFAGQDAVTLKGAALEKALDDAGLAKDGTADEKRARLEESRLL